MAFECGLSVVAHGSREEVVLDVRVLDLSMGRRSRRSAAAFISILGDMRTTCTHLLVSFLDLRGPLALSLVAVAIFLHSSLHCLRLLRNVSSPHTVQVAPPTMAVAVVAVAVAVARIVCDTCVHRNEEWVARTHFYFVDTS